MSQHKDPGKNDRQYSVDEILAEYGSGKYEKPNQKVVEFPEADKPASAAAGPRRPEAAPREPEPMAEIVPENPGRSLAARLSTLLRRADHYADHMYDQAEPDEETRRAEKYIPGVDREEIPEEGEPPRPRRAPRRPAQVPPDTAPADLAARWQKGLKGRRVRILFTFLFSLLSVAVSLDLPFWDWNAPAAQGAFPLPVLRLGGLALLLLAVGLLALEIVVRGILQLFRLRPRAETLLALAWLFTLADTLAMLLTDYREGLPCACITSMGLAFALWGDTLHRRGDRLSAKSAAQARTPYVVTLDENKWSGRPAYAKWSGSTVGFGSQLQMEDGAQRAYRIAAPLLLLACLLCALMASVGRGTPGRFLWAASSTFTAAASWSALIAYALPYHKLAARLHKVGAAVAGWPGVRRCRQAGILTTDLDLFPPGSVQVAQVKVFGGVSTEKVVAYTATMLRVLNCGLTRPFHDLLRAQGAIYREVSGVVRHEGGLSGIIRNQEVLVGTASFMHIMKVALPQGLNIKNAVFCAIDGHLAGMFPLNYAMSSAVNPSLSALMRAGVSPILATRDFNLIPSLLEQKFKLPVDRMEFPPVERRFELSEDGQEHDDTPVAVLCREGLSAFSDAAVGGRRLRSATHWSLIFTLIGSVAGLCLTFYLTSIEAYGSLTPVNFLVFMLAWLVPELLIANWVNQY